MTISGYKITIYALCAALPLAAAPSLAQPGPPAGRPSSGGACQPLSAAIENAESAASGNIGPLNFSKATIGLIRTDGLFPLYENPKNGDLFMEIDAGKMEDGISFIYNMQAIRGVASMGVVPNAYLGTKLLKIGKHFQNIEITQENTNFYINPDSPMSRAAADSISDALLVTTEIIAQEGDGSAARYLVCANEIFKSEALASVTPRRPSGGAPDAPEAYSVGNVDAAKSKIIGHANYPKNTDVRVEYVFSHPDNKRFGEVQGGASLADPRNVSMQVRHMLIEAPEDNGYVPRRADFRVGYFGPKRVDLSSLEAAPYHDFIARWNLQKKFPEQEVSEPLEPIVWWISNSTPHEYRDEIERGVLVWNKALERVGFRNAIIVRQQPDDADWDAGDLRYNTLYFASNPQNFFLGYGPSLKDPRTGQILGADIALEFSIVRNADVYARAFGGVEDEFDALTALGPWSRQSALDCSLGLFLAEEARMARAVLSARGASPALRQHVTDQLMTSVVIHEVGHTLGLTHNMKASSSISLDTLLTTDGMTTGSIMDYLPANVLPSEGERQTYYQTELGPYDYWAIEYGYHPELDDTDREKERVRALLSKSTETALAFGNDAEVVQYNLGVDPRVLMHDMSSDLVGWSALQAQAIDEAIATLEETHVEADQSYQDVRNTLNTLLSTKRRLVATLAMFVGGAHMEVATAEQLEAVGKAPFEPIAAEEQMRAVELVIKLAYAPGAYDALTPSLLKHAQNVRRGYDYGEPGRGEPLSIQDIVAKDQAFLLQYLLSPLRLNRLTAHEALGGEFTSHALLNSLTDGIFGKSCFAKPDQYQRIGQAAYLGKLITVAADAAYDENAKAAAENSLSKISRRISGLCNVTVGEEISGHRKILRRMLSDR